MAYLNANIPATYAQVRREYLYDLKEHHGEAEDCIIFALASLTGRPILFHAIMENGAIFYRLPISAFLQKDLDVKKVPRMRLDELELWNCFSYYPSVTTFDLLDGQSGKYIGKDKKWYPGSYLFTVDWAHPIMALENGNYAAQPNNRLIWSISSFTVKDEVPFDWKTQSSEWNVEKDRKWKTEDSDRFFYNIEETKNDKMDKNKT